MYYMTYYDIVCFMYIVWYTTNIILRHTTLYTPKYIKPSSFSLVQVMVNWWHKGCWFWDPKVQIWRRRRIPDPSYLLVEGKGHGDRPHNLPPNTIGKGWVSLEFAAVHSWSTMRWEQQKALVLVFLGGMLNVDLKVRTTVESLSCMVIWLTMYVFSFVVDVRKDLNLFKTENKGTETLDSLLELCTILISETPGRKASKIRIGSRTFEEIDFWSLHFKLLKKRPCWNRQRLLCPSMSIWGKRAQGFSVFKEGITERFASGVPEKLLDLNRIINSIPNVNKMSR